ncbi:LytTR family transcriptional regulator [Weissella coleopterorum]|uniref:LytTR family transcriptional regulator n=1 Tax=Weissella coleopterorum TaxID=2714949 RepID=A0A6G8AYY9_9LACO|nr:LytTR family DNA-binding domain-containing protein [Weissella coleopterorum]QIL50172.1 LytTR family transcriptional regulator [Weissella coleopterorum]
MKITLEIDPSLTAPEVIIRAPAASAEVNALKEQLSTGNQPVKQITLYQHQTKFELPLDQIIFFETDERQVWAHTVKQSFATHQRLYTLEATLPPQFIRISKAGIVNVTKIQALTKSISNTLIQFQNSHKQIYASRRYHKALEARLQDWRKLS